MQRSGRIFGPSFGLGAVLLILLSSYATGVPAPTPAPLAVVVHPAESAASAPRATVPHPSVSGYTIAIWNRLCANTNGCVPNQPPQLTKSVEFWDPVDQEVVYFGGATSSGSATNQTWMWSALNQSWNDSIQSIAPNVRTNASSAWDVRDGYGVVFGGYKSGPVWLADTWKFSGQTWSKLSPTTAPNGRAGAMMTYVPNGTNPYVLLFGGLGQQKNSYKSDTWEFIGGQWTNITATAGTPPTARSEGGFVYDSVDGYALLFGGLTKTGIVNDTWKFIPSTGKWAQICANNSAVGGCGPKARFSTQMAMDAHDGAVFLFGGGKGNVSALASESAITAIVDYYFVGGVWTNDTTNINTKSTAAGTTKPLGTYGAGFVEVSGVGFQNYVLLQGGKTTGGLSNATFQLGEITKVGIQANPLEFLTGGTVKLWANATAAAAPVTYTWTLPAGCTSSNASVITCTPTATGVLAASVSIVDNNGASGSANLTFVVDTASSVNVAALPGAYVDSPNATTFWGGDWQGTGSLSTDNAILPFLQATPIRTIRFAGPTEGYSVATNTWYAHTGATLGSTPQVNLTELSRFCIALGCHAIIDLPALENNTTATKNVLNWVKGNFTLPVLYYAFGNEPQGWTQYPNQFFQFNTSYNVHPTAAQYGALVAHLNPYLEAHYPGITFLQLQSSTCGSNGILNAAVNNAGTALQTVACHMYPGGSGGTSPQNISAKMLSAHNITSVVGKVLSTYQGILASCPTCTHVPLLVNEFNAALQSLYCSLKSSWPEVPYIAATMSEFLWLNVSDVAIFSIDPGSGCFNSMFDASNNPKPLYYLYSNVFQNFHLGSIFNVSFTGAMNGLYGIEGTNSTGRSLLLVNANTTVSANVVSTGQLTTYYGATVIQGSNPSWTTSTYGTGAFPAPLVIPPMGVVLINTPLANVPQPPTNLHVTGVTSNAVSLAWTLPPGTTANSQVLYGFRCDVLSYGVSVLSGNSTIVSGLAPGTTYCFAAEVANSSGFSGPSATVAATTAGVGGGGGGPPAGTIGVNLTGPTGGIVSGGAAILTWALPGAGILASSVGLILLWAADRSGWRVVGGILFIGGLVAILV